MKLRSILVASLLPAFAAGVTLTPKDGEGEPVKVDLSGKSEVTIGGTTYLVEPDKEPKTLGMARRIVIPVVDFEDITVEEAIDFLRIRSAELDESKAGINFVTKQTGKASVPRLFLRNTTVHDILGFIAELSGTTVDYRDAAIVVSGD